MSVLFLLSNIAVPFLILSYTSLVQVYQTGTLYSAKWFLLIVYTFISNIIVYFMDDSRIFLIVDLIAKLGIVFLPDVVNASLEKIIAAFHLELVIEIVRGIVVPWMFLGFSMPLQFVVSKLSPREQGQFKTILVNVFERAENPSAAPLGQTAVLKQYPQFANTGVNCELITMGMLNSEIRQKQLLKLQLSQKKIESTLTHHGSTGDLKSSELKSRNQPSQEYSMKKKPTFSLQKSNTDIGLLEQEDRAVYSRPKKQEVRNHPREQSRHRYKSPQEKRDSVKQQSEPSMILDKLDVSEYSDMFQGEDDSPDRKLVTKVETIIEIAGMSTARLEIYNIELYSNSQIRIISLYGRQFERHRLISMKPLKHGYYELKLEGGKVQVRKVKFRGPFEPFLKYLQPQI